MNTETLNAYFEMSGFTIDYMKEKSSKNFDKFLSGEKSPTFKQLIKIAKLLSIPVGLLMLDKPIEKPKNNLKFRTINSEYIVNPSKELQDTIAEMNSKQDFLHEEVESELEYIGKFSIFDDYMQVANYIRDLLEIKKDYYLSVRKQDILYYFRERINRVGIFVFFNGKYKDNTSRSLNVGEFRGFTLVDKKAPIIFINQKDAKNGQLFTLIHELVHIFIGDEEIYGTQHLSTDFDKTEAFVNKVTAEILVPNDKFLQIYKKSQGPEVLANNFKVSEFVIVRRMLDNKKISHKQYLDLTQQLTKQYEQQDNRKKAKGGNYRNTLRYRIDRRFFNYVENAVNERKLSYTDAFNLVGVSYKGYSILKESR